MYSVMGKENKYRVLGGNGNHQKSTSSNTTTNKLSTKKSVLERETSTTASVPSGCMSGVFHLFDFHQFQFSSLNHQMCFKPNNTNNNNSFILDDQQEENQQPNITIKGVEAPRNSLESEENLIMGEDNETVNSSSEIKEEDFGFPTVGIRVQTKVVNHQREGISDFSSSESSNSPCIKTPSLVARLMGLDLLPDQTLSPTPSSASSIPAGKSIKTHRRYQYLQESINGGFGSRSLPDTPRISSARRSDVDPSRLSLQINKENIMNEESDYFSSRSSVDSISSLNSLTLKKLSRKREWMMKSEDTENSIRSPSHYARQIVKQVKESVSRKMGRDITNLTNSTNNNNNNNKKPIEAETRTVSRHKKPSCKLYRNGGEDSTASCSPRLRFLETKNVNKPVLSSVSHQDQTTYIKSPRAIPKSSPITSSPTLPKPTKQSKVPAKPKFQPLPQHQTMEKCKKASCERFTQRKEKSASASNKANLNLSDHKNLKKSTTTPLSSKDYNVSVSPSPTPIPTSMIESSSKRNSSQFPSTNSSIKDKLTDSTAEYLYVSRILKCTGIEPETFVSITRWFSPSHPLDPSIFNHLEDSLFSSSTSTTSSASSSLGHHHHRSNRKLIFNLVDEILVEILRPYMNMKPWMNSTMNNYLMKKKLMRGNQLLDKLCSEIKKFPSANCQILQDIDALIEKDLPPDANLRTVPIFEEGESIVFEIERDILDSLVHELALMAFVP